MCPFAKECIELVNGCVFEFEDGFVKKPHNFQQYRPQVTFMRFLSNTQDSVSPHCNRNLGSKASARKRFQKRLRIERLEERRLLAGVIPDDPGFPQQWELHNTGQSSSAWLGQGPTGG